MAELNDLIYHFSNDGLTITVEVRPLVKCKECKFKQKCPTKIFGNHSDDWFCADGAKMGGEERR